MAIHGRGRIEFSGKMYNCPITLDPNAGEITAKIPSQGIESSLKLAADKSIFNQSYTITDLDIVLPSGKMPRTRIENLRLKRISPGSYSVIDSELIRSFSLADKEIGIITLVLSPKRFFIRLPYTPSGTSHKSELIFENSHLSIPPNTFIGRRNKIEVVAHQSVLVLKSNRDLLKDQDSFGKIYAICQGGLLHYRMGFNGNILEINFAKNWGLSHLGRVFVNRDEVVRLLKAQYYYWKSLNRIQLLKHKSSMNFIIDSFNNSLPIESRVNILFTALEAIDGSPTLDDSTVASTLGIELSIAKFIRQVRNEVIHAGSTLSVAVEKSRKELKLGNRLNRLPYPAAGKMKIRRSFRFYIFLLTLILKAKFREAGFSSGEPITYGGYLHI